MHSRTARTRTRFADFSAILISLILTAASLPAHAEATAITPESPRGMEEPTKVFQDRWGIEVLSVRLAAAGHMVDFRYRVSDSEKARPLFARKTKPMLLDLASGTNLMVANMAKTGPLRSSNDPIAGRTYFMFFGNPGLLKAGSVVTISIGDFRAENLVVE